MGSCTFGLVLSNILMCIVALEQLFRNTFHFYRYNLLLCLLEPVIECRVWNIVANAERVDGNSIGLTLGFVEEPQSFKIFFAKHNLSSFKFSTKVCERDMLVNTPILEAYGNTFGRGEIKPAGFLKNVSGFEGKDFGLLSKTFRRFSVLMLKFFC